MIDFIKNTIGNLEMKYDEVYLLRNEEVYKIHDFDKGRGFQPDFILFLNDEEKEELYYQVFIEPKGNLFLERDGWKNDFLIAITELFDYGESMILRYEDQSYILIGLPLYNQIDKADFEMYYGKLYEKQTSLTLF